MYIFTKRPEPRPPASAARPANGLLAWLSCATFGHWVDNRMFRVAPDAPRRCRCDARVLQEDGAETRIRHILSCFLRHHSYRAAGARDGHHEYVCTRCGHPLLFEAGRSPYAHKTSFRKKARYLCSLFGHQVHEVVDREGFTEYACGCGHTFLKRRRGLARITHPLICVTAGHFVRFIAHRGGYAEYVCRNCGHTFCFVAARRPV